MVERPPIVMIHGMWTRGRCFDRLRARFEARGHRVLTPTLPFHDIGPDDPPPPGIGTASLIDYTDALEEEILAFDRDAILIGHSMGGLLAQKLAARGLGSALVCLAPAPSAGMFPLLPSVTKAFFKTIRKFDFWRQPVKGSWEMARWAIFNGGVPEAEARSEFAQQVWESGRVLFEFGFWYLDGERAAAVNRDRIRMPVLIVVGAEDRITPVAWARSAARRFEGRARYQEYPGFGHWLIGEPALPMVAARIERFLATGL
ncbi:MAG: alpha/beta hydrolase [Rhodothalassiaceae bacterium]